MAVAALIVLIFQYRSIFIMEETLAAVAQSSSEFVEDLDAEARRTVHVESRATTVAT